MHFLDSLSPAQKEAATHINGPQLIIAGAGAGKTKTITARIAHIIEQGTRPDKILAVTFTNKAAKEMRERVHTLLGGMRLNSSPVMLTFHALGVSILREHGELLGLKRGFSILDEDDTMVIYKECLKVLDISPKEHDPKIFRSIISRERQDGVTDETYNPASHGQRGYLVAQVWRLYNEKKKQGSSVDFDDLLTMPIEILKKFPNVKEIYNSRFDYVHVDEYQDVNDLQVEMVELILGQHNNVCVVGDADQTIYSWRGSKIEHIINFEKKFAPTHVVMLEENYRSSKIILDAANKIVKKNKNRVEKNLFTNKPGGELITILECVDEYDEAKMIVEKTRNAINNGVNPKEIAVLYRANYQSRVLEEAFLHSGVPYTMVGTRFFDRREVKDTLSYIRASMNRNSLPDLTRAIGSVSRGIGKTTLAKIISGETDGLTAKASASVNNFFNLLDRIALVVDSKPPSEALIYTIRESGLENALKEEGQTGLERLENIKELASLASNYDQYGMDGMMLFLEHAALYESDVVNQNKGEGVTLMTVHAAKGLEWDTVFITGLEQFVFPHASEQYQSQDEREEERRLMYVAVTRAKRKLYTSYAQLRTIFGQKRVEAPSEFLYDIPEDTKEIVQSWGGNGGRVVYLD
jgi:DNA helicase-2/ATP-dependent DNA helicase PcrA